MILSYLKYWKNILIALLVGAIIGVWWFKNVQIENAEAKTKEAKSELMQYKTALEFLNATIEAQRIDAEKLKNLPKTIERIKDRYIVVYPEIEAIKDNNATFLLDRLNSFQY